MSILNFVRDFEQALSGNKRYLCPDWACARNASALKNYRESAVLSIVGDVASYYLPYVEQIIAASDIAKFPVIKRDREEVVESFIRKVSPTKRTNFMRRVAETVGIATKALPMNHWQLHDGSRYRYEGTWDMNFPKYPSDLTMAQAISRYWDEYYSRTEALEEKYPGRVKTFQIVDLSTAEGQRKILGFLGVEAPVIIDSGIKLN